MAQVIKKATRESFGMALCELAKTNKDIIVFDADLAAATKTGIFKTLWKLLFNIGKAFVTNPQVLIFAPLGMIWDRRSPENAYMLSCFLFTAFFVYIGSGRQNSRCRIICNVCNRQSI